MRRLYFNSLLILLPLVVLSGESAEVCDFNEGEYRRIAEMVSGLSGDVETDAAGLQKRPLLDKMIWRAFVWRFYQGNQRRKNLYFVRLGDPVNEVDSAQSRNLFRAYIDVPSASPLVANEIILTRKPTEYTPEELRRLAEIFSAVSCRELHETIFFTLLINKFFLDPVNEKHLANLSEDELTKIKKLRKNLSSEKHYRTGNPLQSK